MNLDNKFNSSTIQEGTNLEKKYIFQATTEQFKKYTTIEANRKIKSFFKNQSDQNNQSNLSKEKQLASDSNKSKRDTILLENYLPLHNLNPRFKTKKGSFNFIVNPSNPTINNTITIEDNSDDEDDIKDKRMNNKKLMRENRSFSLKAYLDEKPQQKLILPKIGRPQNIIEIVEKEFKQSKQKRKHPRARNFHQITLDRQAENSTSQLHKYQNFKSPSQRQVFKSVPSKQSLKPLLDLDQTSSYSKKRKIELMGMKLKPVEREDSKIGKIFENRTERIGSLNLLPSQLIYKNPKQSIEKSVYQQLIKRVFSTS